MRLTVVKPGARAVVGMPWGPPTLRRRAHGPAAKDHIQSVWATQQEEGVVEHVATISSAVIFVRDLDRSLDFYRGVFGCRTSVRDVNAALLVSPDGFQLYLVEPGDRVHHPLGGVGLQYLIWAVESAEARDHFEQILRDRGVRTATHTSGGVEFLTAHDPDGIRVVIAHPSPRMLPRSMISSHVYTTW
jgi:catechol 2,3-dioxygenase-like lactoylglutathione lyase family enzyme